MVWAVAAHGMKGPVAGIFLRLAAGLDKGLEDLLLHRVVVHLSRVPLQPQQERRPLPFHCLNGAVFSSHVEGSFLPFWGFYRAQQTLGDSSIVRDANLAGLPVPPKNLPIPPVLRRAPKDSRSPDMYTLFTSI
mgnify:FL=1